MEKKSEYFLSNEEIIADLTKDLEDSCIKDDPSTSVGSSKTKDESHAEDESELKSSSKVDESDAKTSESPNEFDIDEERLKDRELELTEDEKHNLRSEAESLKNEGNRLFLASEFHNAMRTYTAALLTCPLAFDKDRAILYANRAAASIKHGEKDSAIVDCTKAIELNPTYLKAYLRRAQLYEETDKLDESLADFKKILELDPRHSDANHAVRRLPPIIQERNEKLKDEMIGKLKDLGNLILKPFGLSTNNFNMEQDPATGSYSVKFNQSPS
ncbi:hypothetical protein PV327_001278 [Microctonus hyperodae]|uniref:Tetratricopeptide repeat protein 1 n=1 Tax=Microctonus hyperodae TaxID=165561 RepID=A0AA39G7Y8_MICHY|nr:hypothetical protein PV327_001278 [Microctonus hyperodae]